ncbi:HhH-GPD superfamily base excision DNA repair protein [Anatilimnocola aggregata]|uniref:DNA-3-methyladenine glycosylase II n=1 Tax=Anatilimnocola aggregata TaxID=2528021 RepID=A0A517Y4P1_9BACT|nr:DNA-3-methyladenine glycosylase [Anatilimnocola aggregata]QDU25219.1 HhH-GPD superfamily base excision DNA repair protein [Anatilimnocola aggregata]
MPHPRSDEIIAHLSAVDKKMGRLIQAAGPLLLSAQKGTIFSGLMKSIVYQQLSGKAAGTIHGRVLALLPAEPSEHATAIAALSDEVLRGAGLSRNKLLSIRDLAARSTAGLVPERKALAKKTDEEIIELLTEVRGVGRWTAEMILMFTLGRLDVLPVADLGIRKGFGLTYLKKDQREELPALEAIARHGERWRPFRSAAAWYLWRACDLASQKPA